MLEQIAASGPICAADQQTKPPETLKEHTTSGEANQALTQGVALERVPTVTLETVKQLIPASKRERGGERFLVSLLAFAEAKQFALPGQSEASDAAMIQVQSIRELAKKMHWGYDTTDKYIMVLIELGFLYKRRYRNYIELYFPLSPYQLPQPDLFDQIKKRRDKVNSFVGQVKRRFTLLLQRQPTESPTLEQDRLRGLVEDIHAILHDEIGDSELQARIVLKIHGSFRYRCDYVPERSEAGLGELKGYSDAAAS